MHHWIVWQSGLSQWCYECSGGGDSNVWQVYAESAVEALQLVIRGGTTSWDESADLHCLAVGPSKARKSRLLKPSEWLADQSMTVEPPSWTDENGGGF